MFPDNTKQIQVTTAFHCGLSGLTIYISLICSLQVDSVTGENKAMRRQLIELGERMQILESDNFAQDQALRSVIIKLYVNWKTCLNSYWVML